MMRIKAKTRGMSVILLAVFLFSVLGITPAEVNADGLSYYVDSVAGSDSNDGKSEGSAWKTLDKVNATEFKPGEKILLKAGSSWTGTLMPKGSGTAGSPIIIDMYGSGNKPLISGGGVHTNAVHLKNQSYWEINNLELTNDAPENDVDRRGVYIEGNNAGVLTHIYMRNLAIHHIKGLIALGDDFNKGKASAGIYVNVSGDKTTPTRFDDVLIEGCTIYTVDSSGIATSGSLVYPRSEGWEQKKFTNFVIQNNTIYDIGKNAMIVRLLDGGLIQNNVVYDTAFRAEAGNQIFTRTCWGTVIQNNEGYLNKSIKGHDGSGYDADLESPAVIFQYNYTHDNNHGLYWQCTVQQDKGIIVRYNISQNDKGIIFNIGYPSDGTDIYNNTVYIKEGLSPLIIAERSNKGGTREYSFKNNIIYNDGNGRYLFNDSVVKKRDIDYNLFYGKRHRSEPDMPNKITGDPKFISPGGAGIGIDTATAYKIQSGSAAIDAGVEIADNGGFDFFGNPLYSDKPDIGAHELQKNINMQLKIDSSDVVFNGINKKIDVPASVLDGRTMLPARFIAESLDATVLWDAATQTVTIKKGSFEMKLVIGSNNVTVNGSPQTIDVPATVINGRTMLPARFIAESLGATVDWNEATSTATINYAQNIVLPTEAEKYPVREVHVTYPLYTASHVQDQTEVLNDKTIKTEWGPGNGTLPVWVTADMGQKTKIEGVYLYFRVGAVGDDRAYQYYIETSDDNVNFTKVLDKSDNKTQGEIIDAFSAEARYVKVTVTGVDRKGKWMHMAEFDVITDMNNIPKAADVPDPTDPSYEGPKVTTPATPAPAAPAPAAIAPDTSTGNIALNTGGEFPKASGPSGSGTSGDITRKYETKWVNDGLIGGTAADGSEILYWRTNSKEALPIRLQIDFGSAKTFSKVVLKESTAYKNKIKRFKIQVSSTGKDDDFMKAGNTVYTSTEDEKIWDTGVSNKLGGKTYEFKETTARYIRIYVDDKEEGSTIALTEFEVY